MAGVVGRVSLRSSVSRAALATGIAVIFTQSALAQSVQQVRPQTQNEGSGAAAVEGSVELSPITVEGNSPNALNATTGLARLPGTIQDTPQIVNVISQQTLQEQNVTTLEEALRNVPGVTQAIGEGNGGLNGDQFKLRGFEAKGDIYLDGLRDFGVYVRDSFNAEEIQVLKGPSSESFGMGTTGGAINTSAKTPFLQDMFGATIGGGNGPMGRATVDVNRKIGEATAIRINALYHDQDIVGRDHVHSDRWGFAPSIAFGLGTDTNWTLSYFFQHTDRTPDYGVPMLIVPPGTAASKGLPITEFGVPRSTFYGKETDHDVSNVHMLTSRFKKEVNSWLTISNDTRVAWYRRDFATSGPVCAGTTTSPAAYAASCSGQFFAGLDPTYTYTGGSPTYLQRSWGAQNVLTANAKFNTGFLRHELVVGLDLFYQEDHRDAGQTVGTKTAGTVRNPNYLNTGYALLPNPNSLRHSTGGDIGVFASDRIWFTDQWSILGGIRYDRYKASYRNFNGTVWTEERAESDL